MTPFLPSGPGLLQGLFVKPVRRELISYYTIYYLYFIWRSNSYESPGANYHARNPSGGSMPNCTDVAPWMIRWQLRPKSGKSSLGMHVMCHPYLFVKLDESCSLLFHR